MTVQRRSFNSLPSYLQTDRNNLELAVTDDLLYEPEQADFVSGLIGDTSKLSAEELARTPLLLENTAIRQKYQFSVAIAQFNPDNLTYVSGAFYDDLINHLFLNGAITDDPNRLFSSYYYAWSPPIDYDKIVNPARYYWTGDGTADANGEYITKEPAGSLTSLYKFNGSSLVKQTVTIVDGLGSVDTPASDQIVEDASTPNRLIYQWNGFGWAELVFFVAEDIVDVAAYHTNDYVYVCRTGVDFNRPLLWVYRPAVGRWVALPVVVSINRPDAPVKNMVWEDASIPPARIFRIYDSEQWQLLSYTAESGPANTAETEIYIYDIRDLDSVDSWSAMNWWRQLDDLSTSDRGNLPSHSQASRPIIEFWGNIEPAPGDVRASGDAGRNQTPLFIMYAVSESTFDIEMLTPANFPGLDWEALFATGNYEGDPGQAITRIFKYDQATSGAIDPVLGFRIAYGTDGTPTFLLELEQVEVTVAEGPLKGYRFYKDASTSYVHCIWERTGGRLQQAVDGDGLYDIPKGLKSNPDHEIKTTLTRASYINHFASVLSSQDGFSGTPYGGNNYRYTDKDLTVGATMIDPEESLQRVMAVLQTNTLDIPDAIRQMSREYNKVMSRFVNQLNTYWNNGTLSSPIDTLLVAASDAVDIVCTQIFTGRNSEFPFYYSSMGTYLPTRYVSGVVFVFDNTPQPIYITNSAAHIGGAPVFLPTKFTDFDGIEKIRGHEGSLIPAFGDERDDVIIALETRFFDAVQSYMKTETTGFSARFNSSFHLDNFYGNYQPNPIAGTVTEIVTDYTAVGSPVAQNRIFSRNRQVYAIWNGSVWKTTSANTNDVFLNLDDNLYYIFNGFYVNEIPAWNNTEATFDYSFNEYRQIIQREFERWIVVHDLDFVTNVDFDENDRFTWNYSSAGTEGNYRGIYRRVYRTVRPHSHPWEIIGYSIVPDWWLTEYVPTSYASDGTPRYANTHAMWTDLQNGVIIPITSPDTILVSQKMIAPIPVDADGELLDPIDAGVINEQSLVIAGLGDDWVYGDGSPIEESFYNSYYYPFAVSLAGYLMKTAMFVERTWSEFYREIGTTGSNIIWNGPHNVIDATLTRPSVADVPSHLSLDDNDNVVTNPGLNAWIAEYTAIIGKSPNLDFNEAVINSQAVLGWKASGFINASRTKIELLNGDEIPNEDLSVVLHQGPSISEYYQSGISIVRDVDGFRVFGTDVLNPYFRAELGAKPIRGGQVELTQTFTYDGSNRTFEVTEFNIPTTVNDTASFGVLVNGFKINSKYVQIVDQTTFAIDGVLLLNAGDIITASVVTLVSNPSTQLGTFTVNGVAITYFQSGTGVYVNYLYGTLFQSISDLVNMMVGHGRWLSSQGWVFERLSNGLLRDWLGAAKTFAAWATDLSIKSRGNPALMTGQIFEFSVMGRQTQFTSPFGMVLGIEDIRNGSYGVVDVASKPIRASQLNVVSTGGTTTVSTSDTDIFGLRLYVSEVQHAIFFPNVTTFNDIIYEPSLGLSQDAVFVDTYRSTNWEGRLEAPGFLVLDGRLLPNWEKQTNDITRYYDRFNPVDDPVLVGMARNIFGYVPKSYMDMIGVDDRTKFNFFHGSLKSKGTFQNYKAFFRGTTIGTDNVTIAEDWAWRFARYGDRRIVTVLIDVQESDFVDIFQTIHFDELSVTATFTGDDTTTCFEVTERFQPEHAVVKYCGSQNLQVLGYDYDIRPTNLGHEICFNNPPLPGGHITISVNDGLVHAVTNVYYSESGGMIDTGTALRPNNIFMSVDGGFTQVIWLDLDGTKIAVAPTTYVHTFGDVGTDIFVQMSYIGDGFNTLFPTGVANQTINTVAVVKDGVWLSPGVDYTLDDTNSQKPIVVLSVSANLTSDVVVISAAYPNNVRMTHFTTSGDGSQTIFTVPNFYIHSYRQVIVAVDGVIQVGNIPGQIAPGVYTVLNGNVVFYVAPANVATVTMFVVLDSVGGPAGLIDDDRVIYVPQYSAPNSDSRWLIPPPQDIYRDRPYRFPVTKTGAVDLSKYIYSGAVVDQNGKVPATHLFFWHPAHDLHEPVAMGMVDFKTAYDPARYNQGALAENSNGLVWSEFQIGTVWWDTSSAIYSDYTGFLPDYMRVTREWGRLKYFNATIVRVDDTATVTTLDPKSGLPAAHGLTTGDTVTITGADQKEYNGVIVVTVESSTTFSFIVYAAVDTPGTGDIMVQIGMINVYEWIASPVPPSAWNNYTGQQQGFNSYTGTARNADTASYSTRDVWDVNGNVTTTYYFWVESNTRIIPSKGLAVLDIAGRLKNPSLYEIPFLAVIDPATMFVFIGDDIVLDNYAIEVSYEWYEMPRHVEWLLIGENDDFADIPELVTDKLLDSMLGVDVRGNPVPNVTLSPVDIYGTCYFPAQTVFTDVAQALVIYTEAVNAFLDKIDLSTLPSVFNLLSLVDEYNGTVGFWTRQTYWVDGAEHDIIYDVVYNITERDYRAAQGLYASDDIVQVSATVDSEEIDLWDGDPVITYYQYDGSAWSLVGIENHTANINTLIADNTALSRDFFYELISSIELINSNKIIFTLLFEMLRQNPVCDWFFKTSYIDPHITVPLPTSAYIRPDQSSAVIDAILDLKPYRTKIRDRRVTYEALAGAEEEVDVSIGETQLERITMIFDRAACDLFDENAWDTIPWDATTTYPESSSIVLTFDGNGTQTCFSLPQIVPQESLVVLLDQQLAVPLLDYHIDAINYAVCFVDAPASGTVIQVLIDSTYTYIGSFDYEFHGDGVTDSQILPDAVSEITDNSVVTSWNGVYQAQTDFIVQVTSDTEVIYGTTPSTEIEVAGSAFGGVINDVFVAISDTGNGVTTTFDCTVPDQTENTVIVLLDGVWQVPNQSYTIDNVSVVGESHVVFSVAPANTAQILFYVASNPKYMASLTYTFSGDGSTTAFAIPDLDSPVPPKLFVNLSGIQQNIAVLDYFLTDSGVVFTDPPTSSDVINILVVWTGLGTGLFAFPSPSTIQWDWAFWNYADLGRQEYDFAGLFIGDGVTDSFTVAIPQTTSSLYNVVLKLFENGILTTPDELGITVTTAKISTGVNVFLSAPIEPNTYCALYVSRGFYEGLEPTFGYQNPSGIVFDPTPSTYEHFFARLISNTYDPSVDMTGCPTPEERISSNIDDMFTIVVRTIPEGLLELPVAPPTSYFHLVGTDATTGIGTLIPAIAPAGLSASATAQINQYAFTTAREITGVQATTAVASAVPALTYALAGVATATEIAAFTTEFDLAVLLGGAAAQAESGSLAFGIGFDGTEATAQFGLFAALAMRGLVGVEAISQSGAFYSTEIQLIGVEAVAGTGQQRSINTVGVQATTGVGTMAKQNSKPLTGVEATAGGNFPMQVLIGF